MIHGRVLRCRDKLRSTPLRGPDPEARLFERNFLGRLSDLDQETRISRRLARPCSVECPLSLAKTPCLTQVQSYISCTELGDEVSLRSLAESRCPLFVRMRWLLALPRKWFQKDLRPRWFEEGSNFCRDLKEKLGAEVFFHEVLWSGENSVRDREDAAVDLCFS